MAMKLRLNCQKFVKAERKDLEMIGIVHAMKEEISLIGSFKKLKQGANLPNIDNCIIMSYYSTDKDFIQRVGRLRQNNKIGNIFIFLTHETQEVVWFSKMFDNITNLSMIYCDNVEDCLIKLNKIK